MVLTIRFAQAAGEDNTATYRVDLDSPQVGQAHGAFRLPFASPTHNAIQQALTPNFVLDRADAATQQALRALGRLDQLPQTVGEALGQAICADAAVASLFDRALGLATAQRQSLPVELRFGVGCDAVAALPWELLRYEGRFLVADTSVALSRYPEGLLPPTLALAQLPLRVLLVLSEPLDATPIFPERARDQLLHGLRALDEEGAVIVDFLQPPTFNTLVEAVRNGHYHLLIFYGHGVHGTDGGQLLFEDEYGAGALVRASDLGAALRNTEIRLVVLGACQSATVAIPSAEDPTSVPAEDGGIWRGTAAALVRAGVPLAIGMQVSMRVDAAQIFLRQFALSLAAGKPIIKAVADARVPLIQKRYGESWFIPALYGRPVGSGETAQRLFDRSQPLPSGTADLRVEMKQLRVDIDQLERTVRGIGPVGQVGEIARLRAVRERFADIRFQLAQRTPGGYVVITSPLYGVPDNPIFVGRRTELIQVGRYLEQEQPVVIWGPGGLGKTALAIEVAHRQRWRYPAGVLWLDCRGGPALDTLLDQIGAFCGLVNLEQTPPNEKTSVVRRALAALEERCLLVWDNAEDVWEDREVRRFVRQELPANCHSLLTTRTDPNEAMWPTLELQPLADPAMRHLFLSLAGTAQVKVGGQADLDVIDPMLAWLEGHPLAVTLLVPLAKRRGLRAVWADLQKRPLKGIDAAFAASYDRLTAPQQQLFTRLSVFTIPFQRAAGAALLADGIQPDSNIEDDLDSLQQRALLQWTGERCAFHALLRQFAYARLQEREDVRSIHRLAAEYIQAIGEQRARTPEEGLEEVDQWERAEAWESFARRAAALVGSLDRLGYWGEIEARLLRAQETLANHHDDAALTVQLLDNLGAITYKQVRWNDVIDYYEQSIRIKEQVGDSHGLAQTWVNLGVVYHSKGEWDRAISYYEQALQTLERIEDTHSVAQAYNGLGNVYQSKGKWDCAISYYEQALQIEEQLGISYSMAHTYNNLGLAYDNKRQWDCAVSYYEQALRTFAQVGDIYGIAVIYNNLGLVYQSKGEWDRAIGYYEQSLKMKEQIGDNHGMAFTYSNLGSVAYARGEWNQAIDFQEKALVIRQQTGDVHGTAQVYIHLGTIYQNTGEWERAIAYYEQALQTLEQIRDTHGIAQTYNNLGLAYKSKGEWNRAIGYYEQALGSYELVEDIYGMATTYDNLGLAYGSKGEWNRAITYYEQALQIFEQAGDIHGMAYTNAALGQFYQAQGNTEQAAKHTTQAWFVFARMNAEHDLQRASHQLIDILGSIEAAQTYVDEFLAAANNQSSE